MCGDIITQTKSVGPKVWPLWCFTSRDANPDSCTGPSGHASTCAHPFKKHKPQALNSYLALFKNAGRGKGRLHLAMSVSAMVARKVMEGRPWRDLREIWRVCVDRCGISVEASNELPCRATAAKFSASVSQRMAHAWPLHLVMRLPKFGVVRPIEPWQHCEAKLMSWTFISAEGIQNTCGILWYTKSYKSQPIG